MWILRTFTRSTLSRNSISIVEILLHRKQQQMKQNISKCNHILSLNCSAWISFNLVARVLIRIFNELKIQCMNVYLLFFSLATCFCLYFISICNITTHNSHTVLSHKIVLLAGVRFKASIQWLKWILLGKLQIFTWIFTRNFSTFFFFDSLLLCWISNNVNCKSPVHSLSLAFIFNLFMKKKVSLHFHITTYFNLYCAEFFFYLIAADKMFTHLFLNAFVANIHRIAFREF